MDFTLSDEQYKELSERVRKAARSHYIQPTDVDDIIQDIAVDVLTNQVQPDEYNTVISRHLGKFRQERKREIDRMVRLI